MEYNPIKNTDINISSLALGTWVFGGNMWGGSNEQDCIDAVHAAIDQGINLIDTAPIYGNGLSERIVGKAIQGRRDKLIIATKCGLILSGKRVDINLKPQSIIRECDDSLNRLGVEQIDIYQCHWPDNNTPPEETFTALNRLKEQGKIRHIGLSNYTVEQWKECQAFGEVLTAQNQYSMLERDVEKGLLGYLKETGKGLLAYGPLAGGILTGKYKEPAHFDKGDARSFFYKFYKGEHFKRTHHLLEQLKALHHSVNELALNWVRQQTGVTSVLVGCRTRAQVEQNVKAAKWRLTEEELDKVSGYLEMLGHA